MTDHKPLTFIFRPDAPVSQTASQRIQRWALYLSSFSYTVQHRPGKSNNQADALSRSPLTSNEQLDVEVSSLQIETIESGPSGVIGVVRIRQATSRDVVLSRILNFVQSGWPPQPVSDEIRPYFMHRDELTVQDGVLLWGLRVVVPTALRREILEVLHESHPGATRAKQFARSYVWWPNIDSDIEHTVQSCASCSELRRRADRSSSWSLGVPDDTVPPHSRRPRRSLFRNLLARVGRRVLEICGRSSSQASGRGTDSEDAARSVRSIRLAKSSRFRQRPGVHRGGVPGVSPQ